MAMQYDARKPRVNGWLILVVYSRILRLNYLYDCAPPHTNMVDLDEWKDLKRFLMQLSMGYIRMLYGAGKIGLDFEHRSRKNIDPFDYGIYGFPGVSGWKNKEQEVDELMSDVFWLDTRLLSFLMACDPETLDFKNPWEQPED